MPEHLRQLFSHVGAPAPVVHQKKRKRTAAASARGSARGSRGGGAGKAARAAQAGGAGGWEAEVRGMYEKYNPEKLRSEPGFVAALLRKVRGHEQKLLAKLVAKYGPL